MGIGCSVELVHGMLSQMRGGGSSCKGLDANRTENAVLQDALNAKGITVQILGKL